MPSYPIADEQSIRDGLDYLLSGPAGLGQNFQGFSSKQVGDSLPPPYYLTGNFRIPFTQENPASLYVPAFALSDAEQLDDRTIKYTFASVQSPAPFSLGNGLTVTGITPSTYNSSSLRNAGYSINTIGVVECTTTYVIVRTRSPITTSLGTYVSGGSIGYSSTADTDLSALISTDCNARVTVTGGGDRVFVSSQLTQFISYEVISGPCDLNVWVQLNRYVGTTNNDPVNPDFIFDLDFRLARNIYTYTGLIGSGTLDRLETIFSPIVDNPPPGYYWYILEVLFEYPLGGVEIQVTSDELKTRALSAIVVKP
jgi:hypothetical protein